MVILQRKKLHSDLWEQTVWWRLFLDLVKEKNYYLASMKNNIANAIRVAWFLAIRQIKGSNKATTMLIIFIMMLTFLNLVVVSGLLVGLIAGGTIANREQYSGDVII